MTLSNDRLSVCVSIYRASGEYSKSFSSAPGTRLMLVCEVAVGETYITDHKMLGLHEPPSGYNSVKGRAGHPDSPTDFKVLSLFIACLRHRS